MARMRENEVKVTSKRQFKNAIITQYFPIFAGYMLGANQSLKQALKDAGEIAEQQFNKLGARPSVKRPFHVSVDMEKAVAEFVENIPKIDRTKTPKSKGEQTPFHSNDMNTLIDMFRTHPWQLHHFDHIRMAAQTGPERFELARRIHVSGITPDHVNQAVASGIGLLRLIESVESGNNVEQSLRELAPKKKKAAKPPKPTPSPTPPKGETPQKTATLVKDDALLRIMQANGIRKKERENIPPETTEAYAHAGISSDRFALAYAVHRIQEKRNHEPVPLRELKALLNSRLEHPEHVLFADHVRRETEEKPEVVLYAFEKHAAERDLNHREASIILKAVETARHYREGLWQEIQARLKKR